MSKVIQSHPKSSNVSHVIQCVQCHPRSSKVIQCHPKSSKVIQSHPKSSKVIQSHLKSSKVIQGCPKSSKVIQSHPKSSKVVQSHPKSFKVIQSHPRCPKSSKVFKSIQKSRCWVLNFSCLGSQEAPQGQPCPPSPGWILGGQSFRTHTVEAENILAMFQISVV